MRNPTSQHPLPKHAPVPARRPQMLPADDAPVPTSRPQMLPHSIAVPARRPQMLPGTMQAPPVQHQALPDQMLIPAGRPQMLPDAGPIPAPRPQMLPEADYHHAVQFFPADPAAPAPPPGFTEDLTDGDPADVAALRSYLSEIDQDQHAASAIQSEFESQISVMPLDWRVQGPGAGHGVVTQTYDPEGWKSGWGDAYAKGAGLGLIEKAIASAFGSWFGLRPRNVHPALQERVSARAHEIYAQSGDAAEAVRQALAEIEIVEESDRRDRDAYEWRFPGTTLALPLDVAESGATLPWGWRGGANHDHGPGPYHTVRTRYRDNPGIFDGGRFEYEPYGSGRQ